LKNKSYRGFTLIELALFIVIVGILASGYNVGASLIASSKRVSVLTEIENFKTAVNAFKLKYDQMPGDIPNALAYWPVEGIRDGDGNGIVNWAGHKEDITASGTFYAGDEALNAWRHLYLAGMYNKELTGYNDDMDPLVSEYLLDVNVPKSRESGTGYIIRHTNHGLGIQQVINPFLPVGHQIQWGGYHSSAGIGSLSWPATTPQNAYNIDKKNDDGMPLTGKIVAEWGVSATLPPSAPNRCGNSSGYTLSDPNAKVCRMQFYID